MIGDILFFRAKFLILKYAPIKIFNVFFFTQKLLIIFLLIGWFYWVYLGIFLPFFVELVCICLRIYGIIFGNLILFMKTAFLTIFWTVIWFGSYKFLFTGILLIYFILEFVNFSCFFVYNTFFQYIFEN